MFSERRRDDVFSSDFCGCSTAEWGHYAGDTITLISVLREELQQFTSVVQFNEMLQ